MKILLLGATTTNAPWGFECSIMACLERMGIECESYDHRAMPMGDIRDALRRSTADMLLACRAETVPPDVVRAFAGPKILWYAEQIGSADGIPSRHSLGRRAELSHIAEGYDAVLLHEQSSIGVLTPWGLPRVEWLSCVAYNDDFCGCAASMHDHPSRLFMFNGSLNARRLRMFKAIDSSVLPPFYGYPSNTYDKKFAAYLYQSTPFCLNLHITDEPNTETRVGEVLSAGGCLLSEPLGSEGLLVDGEHYLSFPLGDAREAARIMESTSKERRDKIAAAGHEYLKAHHTREHRIAQIITWAKDV